MFRDSVAASSSRWSRIRAAKRASVWPRRVWLQLCHSPSKARWAATTARSTSSAPPRGTRAMTAPFTGLTTSKTRPSAAGTCSPPITISSVGIGAAGLAEPAGGSTADPAGGWAGGWAVIAAPRAGLLRRVRRTRVRLGARRRARRPTSARIIPAPAGRSAPRLARAGWPFGQAVGGSVRSRPGRRGLGGAGRRPTGCGAPGCGAPGGIAWMAPGCRLAASGLRSRSSSNRYCSSVSSPTRALASSSCAFVTRGGRPARSIRAPCCRSGTSGSASCRTG